MTTIKLEGMDKVLARLNKEIAGIEGRTKKGMIKAALLVKGDAMLQTPRDLGNLAGSAYTEHNWQTASASVPKYTGPAAGKLSAEHSSRKAEGRQQITGINGLVSTIGYTAYYAPFVHEIQKKYATGNWQFLRNALANNEMKILGILKEEAQIR